MNVLFQCSTGSHVESAKCIANELNKYADLSVRTISFNQFYDHSGDEFIRKIGWPIDEVSNFRGEHRFDYIKVRHISRQIRKIILDFNPDIIILGNDHDLLQVLLINEAKKLYVPSLLIQEGPFRPDLVVNLNNETYKKSVSRHKFKKIINILFIKKISRILTYAQTSFNKSLSSISELGVPKVKAYGKNGATYFAVISDYYRDLWIRGGVNPKSIKVLNCPRYDKLYNLTSAQKMSLIHHSKDIYEVLILSQPLVKYCEYGRWTYEQIQNQFLIYERAAEKLGPKFNLSIRFHPSECFDEYQPWWSENIKRLNIKSTFDDIYEQIIASDIIVTVFSTAGFEALVLGKPLITVRNVNKYPAIWDSIENICINVESVDDLVNAVKYVVSSKDKTNSFESCRTRLIERELGKLDGMASDRVAKFIMEICGKHINIE